jgi:hypothetical protein
MTRDQMESIEAEIRDRVSAAREDGRLRGYEAAKGRFVAFLRAAARPHMAAFIVTQEQLEDYFKGEIR